MSGSEAHGGPDLASLQRAGVTYGDILDFSTNVNPFGPAPSVDEAWRRVDVNGYPDRSALRLTEALAEQNDVASDCVLIGAGASQLIWLMAQALLVPGARCLIVGPTYGEYRRAAEARGAQVHEIRLPLPAAQATVELIVEGLGSERPDLLFLCNPNNPTGWHLSEEDLARLAALIAPGLVVVDEAYRAFLLGSAFGPPPAENALLLRSMTKEYGLPGLRLGYLLGSADLLSRVSALQPPWSVSAPAQAAGPAALAEEDHLAWSLQETSRAADQLKRGLRGLGLGVIASPMHYFLVEVGQAACWQSELLTRGCLVRDATSFGLPAHLRIGARRPDENEVLIAAWREILHSGGLPCS